MRFHPIYLPRWRYASGESGLTSNDYGPKESDKIEAAHQLWLNTKEPARRRMRIILNMTHGVRFDSPNKATQYRLDDTQRTCRVWRELRRVWCEQEPTGAPCKALPVAESKKDEFVDLHEDEEEIVGFGGGEALIGLCAPCSGPAVTPLPTQDPGRGVKRARTPQPGAFASSADPPTWTEFCNCYLFACKAAYHWCNLHKTHHPSGRFGQKKQGGGRDRYARCDGERGAIRNPINNPIYNPIYNPINAAKLSVERREAAEAYAVANGATGILSNAVRTDIATRLRTDPELFRSAADTRLRGKTVQQLFDDRSFSAYIGETGRFIHEEDLCWLTGRGAIGGGQNRPSLQWPAPAGSTKTILITMAEARRQLGFRSVELYVNEEKLNTTAIESLLQSHFHHLELGRRFWRAVGCGRKSDFDKAFKRRHLVYLTYSFEVRGMIDAGKVVVVP
jgi:hypothetical protein